MKSIEQKHAPEIQQEPIAWQCDVLQSDATFKTEFSSIEPPVNMYSIRNVIPLYRSHPDAQVEIAKRDERISELESFQNWLNDHCSAGWDKCDEQAAEITRLKGVIGKCEEAFHNINLCGVNSMSSRREMVQISREALAAIKEEGL